jgi:hypothetical protein
VLGLLSHKQATTLHEEPLLKRMQATMRQLLLYMSQEVQNRAVHEGFSR